MADAERMVSLQGGVSHLESCERAVTVDALDPHGKIPGVQVLRRSIGAIKWGMEGAPFGKILTWQRLPQEVG